ncbi:hypothetical protein HFO05_08475 [Rhizobium laguerreae]|uniref:hypothetical protein n=1 Tax=Rhizobium laguerreae TaxID=1076926 RepID=UPI001C8FF38D|nr:hypothetical protein [Rhizobium laguerreae]MBY3268648.1 hypothetical protein [Rhizobium laguerreae]
MGNVYELSGLAGDLIDIIPHRLGQDSSVNTSHRWAHHELNSVWKKLPDAMQARKYRIPLPLRDLYDVKCSQWLHPRVRAEYSDQPIDYILPVCSFRNVPRNHDVHKIFPFSVASIAKHARSESATLEVELSQFSRIIHTVTQLDGYPFRCCRLGIDQNSKLTDDSGASNRSAIAVTARPRHSTSTDVMSGGMITENRDPALCAPVCLEESI